MKNYIKGIFLPLPGGVSLGRWGLVVVAVVLGAAVGGGGDLGAAEPAERPNFVFLITDDISPEDLGPYGNKVVQTPHLDRMAREGLVFDRAYLTISSCSPSRSSMITGRYPHNTGAPELHSPLPAHQRTFVQELRAAGYYTVLAGKNHMAPGEQLGFARETAGGQPAGAEDWVQVLRERPKDRPFFCWFGARDAHRDWQPNDLAPVYDPAKVEVPPYLFDGPETRADLAAYYHEVSRADYYLGQVLEELGRQGIAENTYVLFLADNGKPFPRAKVRLYESGIKMPLLLWRPGTVAPGRTAALVSAVDLAPTLLELAGLPAGPTLQGVSFRAVLRDRAATVRDYAFAERNWHVYNGHERMVRYGDWLYIRNWWPHRRNLSTESDDSQFPAAQELWEAFRQGRTNRFQEDPMLAPRPEEELFHVPTDPYQFHNLADDPAQFAVLDHLREVLVTWVRETGDTVPTLPTKDRVARPRGDARGEMPGDLTEAWKIQAQGPVRADGREK